MLVRCNTVARGHSAVSLRVIEAILALLRNNSIPVIPLRGSISASGDLSPLSYIAGAITGNPDIHVQTVSGIVTAEQALQQINIDPIVLGPKEGLGLMNGTATSALLESLRCMRYTISQSFHKPLPQWLWRHFQAMLEATTTS